MQTFLFHDLPYVIPILIFFIVGMLMYVRSFLVAVVGIVIAVWLVSVFRVGDRRRQEDLVRDIVSPVDGTLLEIREQEDTFAFVFFSSIFDSQAQWAPYPGKVSSVSRETGDQSIAWSLEDHDDNERHTVVVGTQAGELRLHKVRSWMTLKERSLV